MGTGRELAKRREALKQRGPRQNWTQTALAKRLGLAADTIVRLENDQSVKLTTYQKVEDELRRGERDLLRQRGMASSLLTDGGSPDALTDAARAEIRALAARIVEIAKSLDRDALETTPTPPSEGRRRRRRPHR